jgi:hypothetical protein
MQVVARFASRLLEDVEPAPEVEADVVESDPQEEETASTAVPRDFLTGNILGFSGSSSLWWLIILGLIIIGLAALAIFTPKPKKKSKKRR